MRVKFNKENNGITITNNKQKLVTNNHAETLKLLEKIELTCWGSSHYSQ